MPIIHARIDDRLIHGQIATVWTNSIGANRIMVANDQAAADELQKGVLKLATPPGIKLSVLPVDEAATRIKAGKYDGDKVLLIVKTPRDCVRLLTAGVALPVVNVGNMAHKPGAVQIKNSVSVTKDDIDCFQQLSAAGVKLTAQMVPDEAANDLLSYLKDLQ